MYKNYSEFSLREDLIILSYLSIHYFAYLFRSV